jgi:hypothetical protein
VNHVSNQLTTIDIPQIDSNCHCSFWVQNKVCLAMTMAVTHHSVLWIQSAERQKQVRNRPANSLNSDPKNDFGCRVAQDRDQFMHALLNQT